MSADKQSKRGLVLVNTGEGKGKTTAALGAAVRAAGQGLRVLILQFIKGRWPYGELAALAALPGVEIRPLGLGLIKRGEDLAPHRQAAREAWALVQDEAASDRWDLLILDEVFSAMKRGFVSEEELAGLIQGRPAGLHLILTGRDCPAGIMDLADMVTEMRKIKHHLEAGVTAQKGVEF